MAELLALRTLPRLIIGIGFPSMQKPSSDEYRTLLSPLLEYRRSGILLTFSIHLLKANSPQWQPSMPPAQQLNAPQAPWKMRLQHRGRLIYVGAGTSGRLAVQDGAELIPTFGWPQDRLLLLIAGGQDALLQTIEGAEDDVDQAVHLIGCHQISAEDVLIAVAASGTTPFTLACLREGRRRGALTVGIANNHAHRFYTESHYAIWLDTGCEPIAGSTTAEGRYGAENYTERIVVAPDDSPWQGLSRSNGRRRHLE